MRFDNHALFMSLESARQRQGVLCYIPLAASSLPPPPSLLVACRSPRSPPAFMPRYCHTNSKQSICIMCNLTGRRCTDDPDADPTSRASSRDLRRCQLCPMLCWECWAQAGPVVSASEQTISGFKISSARDTTMTLFIKGPSTNALAVL